MTPQTLRSEVQALLNRLARAMIRGDATEVAKLWETPALVVDVDVVMALSTTADVEEFFASAKEQSSWRGIVETRPDLIDLEGIGERIVIATVRWPSFDRAGKLAAADASDYTLRRDNTGALKIRCVLARGGH